MRKSQYPFLIVSYFSANAFRHCLASPGFSLAFISATMSRAGTLTDGISDGMELLDSVCSSLGSSVAVDCPGLLSSNFGINSLAKESIDDRGRPHAFNTLAVSELHQGLTLEDNSRVLDYWTTFGLWILRTQPHDPLVHRLVSLS